MSYYGEEQPDESSGQRSPDPYVWTNQGPARKIGPKSKYGMNANTGDQVQASQRRKTPTRLGSSPSRLGSAMPQTESRFSASQREAADQTAANASYLASKNGPAKKTSAGGNYDGGKMSLTSTLSGARGAARKAKRGPGYSKGKMHL
jgi:hypothetical protein